MNEKDCCVGNRQSAQDVVKIAIEDAEKHLEKLRHLAKVIAHAEMNSPAEFLLWEILSGNGRLTRIG